ncbi:acyl-CoA dehydrogenase family protein [Corynebacterium sp. CNJ-954]|uniref:acyl-CoA dehydrogenase family protein n=1 Tax=Corynebacterium sp. CNJ-954 TaxID=1904962 RepID=UPI000ABE1BA6|nr:acyl-CoA dehydrogenase family protein [Corynebacterium sp. CNJ-954]
MFAPRTEEQDEFQAVVRDFFATVSSETLVRQAMDTDAGYDPQVWDRMARELQLQGIAVPEEFGGQGFGWTELGIVLEEAGAALLCAPYFATTVLTGMTVLESGDTAAQQEILPGIADGSLIGTLAFPGENRRWDVAGVTATAEEDTDGWTVSGTSPEVIDGQNAGVFIVLARTGADADISLFTVHRATVCRRGGSPPSTPHAGWPMCASTGHRPPRSAAQTQGGSRCPGCWIWQLWGWRPNRSVSPAGRWRTRSRT